MLFNSYEFLLFLLLSTSFYYYVRTPDHRRLVLLFSSLIFYGWWSYVHLALLLGSIVLNYQISRRITDGRRAMLWLAAGIALNLLLLAFFKYADFLISSVNLLPSVDLRLMGIALPLAISFFTFQQIAFLVDTAQGKARTSGLVDYMLFVTFFPQLIAGPIVHHSEMMPQLRERLARPGIAMNLTVGLTIFTIGLFKKTILADQFAVYADGLFAAVQDGGRPGMFEAWCGGLAYSLQIYFDFSGYCDMAIGIARLFGIRLPINFFSPYKARSVIDFWRRWHITLSRFLRDYLYIPLGGSRRGGARRHANLMITMLLGGLWHGAGWTFVAWGGLHGALLVVNHGWCALTAAGRPLAPLAGAGRLLGPALTFVSVVVAWVFFRADSFATAWQVLAAMAGANGLQPAIAEIAAFDGEEALVWLAIGLAVVWFLPNSLQLMRRYRPAIDPTGIAGRAPAPVMAPAATLRTLPAWRPTPLWALASGVVAATAMLGINDVSPFLYFQF